MLRLITFAALASAAAAFLSTAAAFFAAAASLFASFFAAAAKGDGRNEKECEGIRRSEKE